MTQVGHVPGAGSPAADAAERARKEMLRDGRISARNGTRPRIGADVLCEALLLQGVDVIWGYPGGVILPLYDVLSDHPGLRHILVRHEQAAAHAADGYARASGRVGVCLGTSGPGATNLVTGIGTAMLDAGAHHTLTHARARTRICTCTHTHARAQCCVAPRSRSLAAARVCACARCVRVQSLAS